MGYFSPKGGIFARRGYAFDPVRDFDLEVMSDFSLCRALSVAITDRHNSYQSPSITLNPLCTGKPAYCRQPEPYYGRFIGRLTQYAHGIKGTVYAVDEKTIFIRGFAYDGTGPDAYFWVGNSPQPSPEGLLVPYPEDYPDADPPTLKQHTSSDILLRLPGGRKLKHIKWLSVWCRRFTLDPTGDDSCNRTCICAGSQGHYKVYLRCRIPINKAHLSSRFILRVERARQLYCFAVENNICLPPTLLLEMAQDASEFALSLARSVQAERDNDHAFSKFKRQWAGHVVGTADKSWNRKVVEWRLRSGRCSEGQPATSAAFLANSMSAIAAGLTLTINKNPLFLLRSPRHRARSHELKVSCEKKLRGICRAPPPTFDQVNFGDVFIDPNLEPPRARVLPEFKRLAHGLRSGNISVLDAKTFYIPNLHYDGAGPDAYFWVGNGSEPNEYGTKVPNEMGSLHPLRGYQGEDIEIQLPGKMTAYDIDWLAVWCVAYKHNFGHVYLPKDLDVPPALGQTKITTSSTTSQTPYSSTNNCKEILDKRLQVRWEVQGDQVLITLAARLRKDHYMAFGISGAEGKAAMLGSDVVVAYWDTKTDKPRVSDYTITHLAQCDGERGVCPDQRLGGTNDVTLVSGAQSNGITKITYRRPLAAKEPKDKEVLTTRSQSVIAAFGPLNSRYEANAHSFMDTTRNDVQLDFGAQNDNTCIGLAELDPNGPKPWPPRHLAGVTNFTARIGPAGGRRGYTPITAERFAGHPSWGIAWYINDLLIPEIYVERGKNYTFYVEGGDDRTNPAKPKGPFINYVRILRDRSDSQNPYLRTGGWRGGFHPFYISDSAEGGFGQKRVEDQRSQRTFAGVAYDAEGYAYPTAVGRYCEWTHRDVDQADLSSTFEDYMKTLELQCSPGEPAVLTWTVDHKTPDLVYYQCYTHNNLGWKIHVLDPGAPLPIPDDRLVKISFATITTADASTIFTLVLLVLYNMAGRR
ncbi:hypothetical protein EVAR_81439_1 [Eumeta japonica]|uniref:Protein Skeletor n=1 Tax=Eumeta variegata TaxID=151549 RepID=A0A4C1VYK5_EUMVA|nr:hypothetical protein EVAR_81439_1 [Eumeta japonica]